MVEIKRALTAFFFHLPGLRILYGYQPSRPLLRLNGFALAATLIAMGNVQRPLLAWLIGHGLWGAALVFLVREWLSPVTDRSENSRPNPTARL